MYMLCDMLCDMLCACYATYKYAKLHAMYGFPMASAAVISADSSKGHNTFDL